MQGICKNNFMKLSDMYFNKNQCIYEMDTVKGFTIVPTRYDIIILLMTSSTQLEEYIYRTNTCYLTDLNIISCNLSFPNQNKYIKFSICLVNAINIDIFI